MAHIFLLGSAVLEVLHLDSMPPLSILKIRWQDYKAIRCGGSNFGACSPISGYLRNFRHWCFIYPIHIITG